MKEDADNASVYSGGGLKGPLYWLAGVTSAMALKSVSGPGGLLGGLFGPGLPPPGGPGAPVTREILDLTTENQGLKGQLYTNELDKRQSVWNAIQQGRIDCLERQVGQLFTLTRLTVPNSNLNPGVGPVQVVPVPPPAAPADPDVATIVAAVLAAQKASEANG